MKDSAAGSGAAPSTTALQHRQGHSSQAHSNSSSSSDLAQLALEHQRQQDVARQLMVAATSLDDTTEDSDDGKKKHKKRSPKSSKASTPKVVLRPKMVRKSSATDSTLPPLQQPAVIEKKDRILSRQIIKVLIGVLSALLLYRILLHQNLSPHPMPTRRPPQKTPAIVGRPPQKNTKIANSANVIVDSTGEYDLGAAMAQAATKTKSGRRSKKKKYWASDEQELTAVIHFFLSESTNSIYSVDPEVGIDPDLVLDFDSKRRDLLDELETDLWTSKRMVVFSKLRSGSSRQLKSLFKDLDLIPPPSFIDVDERPDWEYLEPLLGRLLGRSDLPIVVLNGVVIGFNDIMSMHESEELTDLLAKAGVGQKPKKTKYRLKHVKAEDVD